MDRKEILARIKRFEEAATKMWGMAPLQPMQRLALLNFLTMTDEELKELGY